MRDQRGSKISVGITSLVVILTVLCFTIFSVLTLSTAIFERNLSQKSAEALKNYYEAETYCSQIANSLGKIWEEKGDISELKTFAIENNLHCQLEENEIYFSYQCPIDERQALFVEISVGETFEIQRWSVQATKEWVADQSLHIWDGESIE
ncbi:hypothetical protein [Anaerotignum sp.]|uniref:hypothetical protein n=1 Tax=Anaerotignum sp. TaxID=2039241 RepID=UPI0033247608